MKTKREEYKSAKYDAEKAQECCTRKTIIEGRLYYSNQLQMFSQFYLYIVRSGMEGHEPESREHYPDPSSMVEALQEHMPSILQRAAEISEAKVEPLRLEALEEARANLRKMEQEGESSE